MNYYSKNAYRADHAEGREAHKSLILASIGLGIFWLGVMIAVAVWA